MNPSPCRRASLARIRLTGRYVFTTPQWRLYADDSKGVCLVLSVDDKLLNSKFVLKRISYGEKDGSHLELDFLLIRKCTTNHRIDYLDEKILT